MKGAAVFLLVFVAIAPQSRAFLSGLFDHTAENLTAWAPFSYIALAILLAAPLLSIILVKTWPDKQEPESPMAKYKKDITIEE
jgi:hypothetical protein